MAGLLRKKPKQESPNPIQVPEKPVALLSSDPPSTPVYARFATTLAQDAVISTPMSLNPRRESITNPSEPIRRNDQPSRGPPAKPPPKLDKPLPPPKVDADPLAEPPPQSNLPPNRRFSSSSRPPSRSDDLLPPQNYKGRRISATPSLPPNSVPSSPQKESFLSRITKYNVAPSSFNRPTTSPQDKGSRSLFRKSSAQDLQHRDSSSNKLKSSSRYSLADHDTIPRQTPAGAKPNLPTGAHVQNTVRHIKRTSQDFSQQRAQSPPAPQNENPYPLPPPPVSRSADDLRGFPNISPLAPNMEVLRPTHPHMHGMPGQVQTRNVSPPQQADQRANRQSVNALTPGKPLIFAATATMANDVHISSFSPPPPQPQSLPNPMPNSPPRYPQALPNSPPRHPQPMPNSPPRHPQSMPNSPPRYPQPMQNAPPRHSQPTATQNYPSPPAERMYRQPSINTVDPGRRVSHTPSFTKHPPLNPNLRPTQPHIPSPPLMRQPSRNDNPPLPPMAAQIGGQPPIPPKQKKTSRSPSVSAPGSEPIPHKLTKSRPTTPVSPGAPAKKVNHEPPEFDLAAPIGVPLDEDPFAKPEGVRMFNPSKEGSASREDLLARPRTRSGASSNHVEGENRPAQPSTESLNDSPPRLVAPTTVAPPSPVSPDEYRNARSKRRGEGLERVPPPVVAHIPLRVDRPAEPFPLDLFLADANLLSMLLGYLSFYDWCILSSVSKKIRLMFIQNRPLTEATLERYLNTVGYGRWIWSDPEPLPLTLMDLHEYMRGVSVPTHEYARIAELYVPALSLHPSQRDPVLLENVRHLTAATRAYTRVVLRLRAQAEKETSGPTSSSASQRSASVRPNGYASRAGSRAPSPTPSSFSHSNGHSPAPRPPTPVTGFRSPLYRLRRAPLLRVFVPSPDGDWLSDASVLECEAELRRAGVQNLLRMGDVVWDVAVGDEGNVGRLVWDGSYLIDLDYSYSAVGDLPKYLPTLAFPPSYFHRVIRAGPASGNPLIRIDISPWGPEIAANLQLLQDRMRTETPQGAVHNVVRWVHRSSFAIRPPRHQRHSTKGRPSSPRIPIPDSNLFIDSGWYGTVVVETEGTNECLADLQDRCGPGAFPPRALPVADIAKPRDKDSKLVFRILRERSRPGEIWIRAVGLKERLC